jgi:hypothetical protein
VVWLVFLFFFSSFFSSASLGRRRRKVVRRKVSQGLKMLQEYSRGVALNPPPSCLGGPRLVAEAQKICRPAPCRGEPPPRAAGWRVHR